jgi:hypothetical protein
MSHGVKRRQTFEIRNSANQVLKSHTLLVNPQDMSIDEPSLSSVTETLGGAYVTDFGQGTIPVSISGVTGYRARSTDDGKIRNGHEEFLHFRNEVYRKFIAENRPDMHLVWFNWEDNEYYVIQPSRFRLQRSKNEPLLYRYEFRFTCIAKASDKGVIVKPASEDTIDNVDTFKMSVDLQSGIADTSEARQYFVRDR